MSGVLDGQVALVTGATSGIGLGIAQRLSAEGAAVCIVSRDGARSRATAEALVQAGGRAVGLAADVRSVDEARQAVDTCVETLGGLDILVANAGIGIIGSVAEADPADWRAMMDTNYLGTAIVTQAALRPMLAQGRGDIVAIASAGGTKGYPDWSGYCATKWAVVGFMDCLAQEVTERGIRVTTLCPGGVDTPFWDALNEDINRQGTAGRAALMQPADIAETVMLQLRLPRNVLVKRTLLFPTSEWH
ncbi:MAG: SDR family oxidoreductase [Chloroflexi bacterium]|nr:SDR family oxidoreductase [Chloroflexota bacterium]